MKKWSIHIILLLFIIACKNKQPARPVLLNKEKIISVPNDSLLFQSKEKNWDAVLLSFTQPIPLQIQYTEQGFILSLQHKYGITEGPAQVMLSKDDQQFFYELSLRNNSYGIISNKDYRSPKTVNPDSSLAQHRITHTIDEWRNIFNAPQQLQSFYEDIIQLNPIAGTYRAQKDKALSSFYVQPGSATTIPLNSIYNKTENVFIVTAGPLKDKHNNTVANGTMVAFIHSDEGQTYRIEAALLNGLVSIKIPAAKNKTYRLMAKINETISKQMTLQP